MPKPERQLKLAEETVEVLKKLNADLTAQVDELKSKLVVDPATNRALRLQVGHLRDTLEQVQNENGRYHTVAGDLESLKAQRAKLEASVAGLKKVQAKLIPYEKTDYVNEYDIDADVFTEGQYEDLAPLDLTVLDQIEVLREICNMHSKPDAQIPKEDFVTPKTLDGIIAKVEQFVEDLEAWHAISKHVADHLSLD